MNMIQNRQPFLIAQAITENRTVQKNTETTSAAQQIKERIEQDIPFKELLTPFARITGLDEYKQVEILEKLIDKKRSEGAGEAELKKLEIQRSVMAKNALTEIERLKFKNEAAANMNAVKKLIASEFNVKGEDLTKDLVHPLYWLTDFNVLSYLLMRNTKITDEQVKLTPHQKYDAFFKSGPNSKKSEEKFIDFIDQLYKTQFNDGQSNYWVREIKKYQSKRGEEQVDGVYHFLVFELYDKHLQYREGLSAKNYLQQKTEAITDQDKRYLLGYYLWSVAEYARVNTTIYALQNKYHLSHSAHHQDKRRHLDLTYEIATSVSSRIHSDAREIVGKLDPQFLLMFKVIKHLDDGDKSLRTGDIDKARNSFEEAQALNNQRAEARDDGDRLTQMIEERFRLLSDLAWLKLTVEKLTGEETPARNKDKQIIFDPKKPSIAGSLFFKVLQGLKDKDLPVSKKQELEQKLKNILTREKTYLTSKDDVKSEIYKDKEKREFKVTPRGKIKMEINAAVSDLEDSLQNLSVYKEQIKEKEKHNKNIHEAEIFVASFERQKGQYAEDVLLEKKSQAKELSRKIEGIPESIRSEIDPSGQKLPTLNKKLEAIAKLGTVNAETLGKDLYKTFLNLQKALIDYRENPTTENLKRLAKYYVPLVMLFSLEDETKSSLGKVFRKSEVDSEVFWKNAVFDPTGQNVFLEEYNKLKANDGKNYLVEGYVNLPSYDSEAIRNTPTTHYSFYELKTAFARADVLGQMDTKHKENIARLEEASWFLRDNTGCIAAYDEVKSIRDINHVIFTFGRLLEKDKDLISMSQFTAHIKNELENNQIMVRYASGGLSYSPENRSFSDPAIDARFDKKGLNNIRRTDSISLLVTAYLLAYDLDYKDSLNDFETRFKYYSDATEDNAARSIFSLSLKRGTSPEQRKKVLLQKLDQVEKYIKTSPEGSREENYYKGIRLVVIEALRRSLK